MTNRKNERRRLLESDIQVYECGQMPPAGEMETAPRLEHWETAVRRRGKEFVLLMRGEVRGHPELHDGEVITSPVHWFDRKERFCRTANRVYVLGQPAGANEGSDA
jgi:hypothetical protein